MSGLNLRLKDNKANICDEIVTALYYAPEPMSVHTLRAQLRKRHGWQIGPKTVEKFLVEMLVQGKIESVGRLVIDGILSYGFRLSEAGRDSRRGRRDGDDLQYARPADRRMRRGGERNRT